MRIVVMGTGGIGGFFACRMAEARADVGVIARGQHLNAIRADGLTLRSEQGDVTVQVSVSDIPADLAPADLVVFTVKGYDNEEAADAIAPLMGPRTRVVSFQNGLAGVDLLAETYGAERVLAGVTYVPAVIEAPGMIRHTGPIDRFVVGALAPAGQEMVDRLASCAVDARLTLDVVADPLVHCWRKLVMLAPFSVISALTRLPLGAWIDPPETRALYVEGMREVVAVARAKGVDLDDGVVDQNLAFTLEKADRGTRGSMLEDLERGRRLELETLAGALLRDAADLGVPTPMLSTCYALLAPSVDGRPDAA